MRSIRATFFLLATILTTTSAYALPTIVCRMSYNGGYTEVSVGHKIVSTTINGVAMQIPVVADAMAFWSFKPMTTVAAANGANVPAGYCGLVGGLLPAGVVGQLTQFLDSYNLSEVITYGNGGTLGGASTVSGGDFGSLPNNQAFTAPLTLNGPFCTIAAGTHITYVY